MVGWGFRKTVECLKVSSHQKDCRREGQSVKEEKLTGGRVGWGSRDGTVLAERSRLGTQEYGHPFPHVESKSRSGHHLPHPGLSQLSAVRRKAPEGRFSLFLCRQPLGTQRATPKSSELLCAFTSPAEAVAEAANRSSSP